LAQYKPVTLISGALLAFWLNSSSAGPIPEKQEAAAAVTEAYSVQEDPYASTVNWSQLILDRDFNNLLIWLDFLKDCWKQNPGSCPFSVTDIADHKDQYGRNLLYQLIVHNPMDSATDAQQQADYELRVLEGLLRAGISPYVNLGYSQDNALFVTIRYGKIHLFNALLEQAGLNSQLKSIVLQMRSNGDSLLHAAIKFAKNDTTLAQNLIDFGFSPAERNRFNSNADDLKFYYWDEL